ncbi:YczE/YyaS/YitT family protein [Arthrobacter sp. KK5.5]|uniref:membrane protein YczE n=1 Tax=Arthrobacter sp. KK5.5 TaxID=3373084 RepID=UPI003EE767E4
MAPSPNPKLLALTPLEQLRAGRLPGRLVRLFVGLSLFGLAMAAFVRASLGLEPWGVFHYGIATKLPLTLGTVVVLVGFLVLLLWIPLRQWPGVGTIANVVWIGVATDVGLALIPPVAAWPAQWVLFAAALVLNALGGGLYIGSQLGPGPRDGLMTGLHLRTGLSLRLVRTVLELSVLGLGWLMGGIVGVGTVLYALLIGPLTQFFLRWTVVELPGVASRTLRDPPTPPREVDITTPR